MEIQTPAMTQGIQLWGTAKYPTSTIDFNLKALYILFPKSRSMSQTTLTTVILKYHTSLKQPKTH